MAIAYRILHDQHRAEDAVQQALVTAWRELPNLRDDDRFDAWLRRLLVHACYAEARRMRRWAARFPATVAGAGRDLRAAPLRGTVLGDIGSPGGTRCRFTDYKNLKGWIVFEHFGQAPDGSTTVFDVDRRMIWLVKADGTGLHELAPGHPVDGKGVAGHLT